MGTTLTPVPFYSDEITLMPHTIGGGFPWAHQFIGREISIRHFCDGQPCSLSVVEGTDDLYVERADGCFMQGPEC